jgi:HAD superfamily hydrolase (TIGR01484 family)
MRYLALCCDYDGTLATDGRILPDTVRALERLLASGRRLVLVTGRELDDLHQVCPRLDLFEYVVAENGALLYEPASRRETPLAQRPPDSFVATLRQRGVERVSAGRVIVATWEPHETTVLETIRDLGLELQVIFNKGAVMVLPAGVTKATGLRHALKRMGLSAHNAVGIGDAENDHALLASCECSAAVSNALPTLKEAADIVTRADHGAGVVELIEEMLRDDLAAREPGLVRHHLLVGRSRGGESLRISPYGEKIVVLGPGQDFVVRLLAQLSQRAYTFCVIDPKGRFTTLGGAVQLGTAERAPGVEEIVKLLRSPDDSGVVQLSGLAPQERPAFFDKLASRLLELRASRGLPHWVVIDEAHELLPAERSAGQPALSGVLHTTLQITPNARHVTAQELRAATLVVASGEAARERIQELCHASGLIVPSMESSQLAPDEVLAWRPRAPQAHPFQLQTADAS